MPSATTKHVAILGAGGRVGRAVTTATLRHGHRVTAVLRDPDRHEVPRRPGLHVVRGDARHLSHLAALLRTVDAALLAVTPFPGPPESFDGFDPDYYATIVGGIDDHWHRPLRRLVTVGHFATLALDSGGAVMDDPSLFPACLRPFADAHARELPALRTTTLDWATLVPPAGLGTPRHSPTEPQYELLTEPVTRQHAAEQLTQARYAQAISAELADPTVHATRVAVVPRSPHHDGAPPHGR